MTGNSENYSTRSVCYPDSVDEVVRQVNEGFVPLISDMDGFVAYFALNAGQGEFGTVSVFHDQQSAEESNRVAEE
jgi:hypothetical protein